MWGKAVLGIGLAGVLAACSQTQLGSGGSLVQGSAGEVGDAEGAVDLASCDQPLGTMALIERQDRGALAQYGLESPVPLLRLLAAQSGCFAVVERGQALSGMMQERDLARQGLLQQGSNVGEAQIIAADYLLTPHVTFSEDDAGAVGGAIASLFPGAAGTMIGAFGGGVSFKEAQTVLTVVDQRTGLQIGAAEGSARTSDVLGGALALGGLPGFAGLGGYADTNEGKVISAAFLDAFNNVVAQLRRRSG